MPKVRCKTRDDLTYFVENQGVEHEICVSPENGVVENEGGAITFTDDGNLIASFAPGYWEQVRLVDPEEEKERRKEVDDSWTKRVKGTLMELYQAAHSMDYNGLEGIAQHDIFLERKQGFMDLITRAMFEVDNPAFVRDEAAKTKEEEEGGK